jgi:hypothetical protein
MAICGLPSCHWQSITAVLIWYPKKPAATISRASQTCDILSLDLKTTVSKRKIITARPAKTIGTLTAEAASIPRENNMNAFKAGVLSIEAPLF